MSFKKKIISCFPFPFWNVKIHFSHTTPNNLGTSIPRHWLLLNEYITMNLSKVLYYGMVMRGVHANIMPLKLVTTISVRFFMLELCVYDMDIPLAFIVGPWNLRYYNLFKGHLS